MMAASAVIAWAASGRSGRGRSTSPRGMPWPLGAQNLLIVSVGTGDFRVKLTSTGKIAALFGGRALHAMTADSQCDHIEVDAVDRRSQAALEHQQRGG